MRKTKSPERPAPVDIRNEYSGRLPASLNEIKRLAGRLLKKNGFSRSGLSLLLVGDRRMRTLNRQLLNHDWTTDVITFGYVRPRSPESRRPGCAGEIIISMDTARKQALEFGHSTRYEFYFYLCHGILHMAGHDDDTPRKRRAMLEKQEKILKSLGVKKQKVKRVHS